MRQVQIRIVGWVIPQGAMYSTEWIGQWFPPPYAPSSTVFAPLSVDIGCLGAVYVDATGNVYISRRSDIPASGVTCYGAVSWCY